ncbi:MAG: AAA family ATPase, partial [Firmicutes bacterium]|nr:AAA family ATPase [Bacillota bacterium]
MPDQGFIYRKDDCKEMSLLDNQVFKRIRNGEKQLSKYKLAVIIDLFIEMIKAIEKIHEKKRIHTSINPGIFIIKPDVNHAGRIKIQLATEIIDSEKDVLNIDRLPYLSPEQTGRTGRSIDHRTDFYSLGITMYELLVGQKPFAAENMVEMIYCHIAKKPVAPDMINPEIPKTISKIIMKLVEKEPEKRYQSAAGICYDLEQCRKSLTLSGVVEDFEIGMNDHSSIFKIPQKLYGRDKESKTISQIYRKAAKGGTQILLVGGYPGVGKTTIIQESFRPVLKPGVFFASGKAEPLQSNTPYFVFSQIAKELIRMLLQEPDVILNQWKNRLLKALDHNGQLIIDLVPELQLIIGTQTGVKELELTENKNRFLNTFGNLFKIFASKKHPLTIFFDDFQWCDLSSLELIRYLIDLTDMESLIVIIGYRDNEIQENHPLNHSLNELRKADKTTELVVKPLDEENVACIIIDAVHCDNERADSLAKIIYKKTIGNPFFVRNLLLHLHTSQYIRYNEAIHLWEWDVAEIQKIEISKNIVDFMINQILELPITTQDLLKVAALIGTTFNLKILADVQRINVDKVVDNLKEAVEREIIIPEHHYYAARHEGDDRAFKFAHDRVQQACAALIEQEGQKQLHLKIGYSIKQRLPADVVRDQAMGIVCHLNEGLDQIECREERFEAARLNLWACQKAKATSSFQLSLQYISKAISLLTDHAWKKDYELTFEMIKVYAECAYLNKEYALAEQQIEILMRHARNSIDQAEIRLMQSILYRFLGQFENVIKYGIQGLRVLGIRMPSEPGLHTVIKELVIVKGRLWGKSTETLLKAPPLQSDKVKLIIRIMSELNSVTYNGGNVNLFLLSTLKSLNLTIRYGNSREAASIYSAYAILLAVLGDLKNSYQFNKLALTLVEAEERAQYRASIYFAYGFLGYSWSESFHDVDQWFKKTMEEAIRYGDHYQIALAGTFMYAFKGNTNLEVLIAKAMEHVPLIRQTSNKFGYYSSFLFLHRWLNYAGLTDDQ